MVKSVTRYAGMLMVMDSFIIYMRAKIETTLE